MTEPAVAQILPLPVDMIITDRVGSYIDPPALGQTGVPLVMSNSPESIRGVYTASALYRASMQNTRFRVFLHHKNASYRPLRIGIAITNPATSKAPLEVYTARNSQMLPSARRGTVHTDPATAGSLALRNWFQSGASDHYLCTLAPGKTYYLLQDVPDVSTVTGMYDFGIKFAGKVTGKPNAIVTVLACVDVPVDPTVIPMMQPERFGSGFYRRGVFPHSERIGSVECDASQISWLDIAGPFTGPHARPLGNELQNAIDDAYALNPGNYGVTYSLRLNLKNPTFEALRVRCIITAAGGRSFSQILVNRQYRESPKSLGPYGSWVFRELTIPPGETLATDLVLTLPGGSYGAHRLYIWPDVPQMQILEIRL